MAKPNSKEFKNIFTELEEISAWFQNEDIDLDEALKKYQRGMELIKQAQEKLKKTENDFHAIAKPTKR